MIEGSIPIALIFRVHYKAMTSAFSSKVKLSSKKGRPCCFKLIFQDPTPLFRDPSNGKI
ncbi:unnamed protein product [Brassica napus]|uniref:(rape) hypothetical protein n=1 Tax=Brassica napus TaxID=3708 RepID=A0A816XZH3_BRANA|nr:unnamed protein product [Brassica napus]